MRNSGIATVAVAVALAATVAACGRQIPGVAGPVLSDLDRPSVTPTAGPTPGAPIPTILAPSVPGWLPVRSTTRAAAYDVPPTWSVASEGTYLGFEDPATHKPRVVSTGAAQSGVDACGPNTSIGYSVLRHDDGPDLASSSLDNAGAWADAAFRDDADKAPKLTPHSPEPITTLAGEQAVVVRIDAVTASPTGGCHATTGTVYAVAAGGYGGELGPVVVLVAITVTGVPGEVPDGQLRQMLTTLRPLTSK